jgi:hypothetical protein
LQGKLFKILGLSSILFAINIDNAEFNVTKQVSFEILNFMKRNFTEQMKKQFQSLDCDWLELSLLCAMYLYSHWKPI